MEQELTYVGKRLPRPDAAPKVTGAAKFGADIELPGMLLGRILRSPYPHAKIITIDTSKAKKLLGVEAVITFEDVPKLPFTRSFVAESLPPSAYDAGEVLDQYILTDKVRYVGDWVAAVAATDVYTAEKALDLIKVEYEQLPAVFDLVEAMKPGAPVIHEGKECNIASTVIYPFNCGDVEKAFEESDYVVDFSGQNSKQKHCHLEPDVAVAYWDNDGRVTVWSPSENAHLAKKALAKRVFGIEENKVRWMTPAVGGGFGARLSFGLEPVCAMLAKVAGKAVKVVATREEDFAGWNSRTEQRQTIKMGIKKNGTITAIQDRIISDAGAYFSHSGATTDVNMRMTLGLFRCPNISGEATMVYTNTPTTSGFRGYGNPEGAFILQQLVDMAAEKAGIDPIEFRLKNIKKVGESSFFIPVPLIHCNLEQCIRLGAERIGWQERWGGWDRKKEGRKRYGLGMSIMTHTSGAGGFLREQSNVMIKLNEDGLATLTVSPCEMGQGILGVLSQIAADAIGLRYEDIHIITGDTDITLFDFGSHASRSTFVIGNAVVDAGQKIRRQVLEVAAKKFRVPDDKLDVREGRVYFKAEPQKGISVAEIAHDAIYNYDLTGTHITATGSFQPIIHNPNFQAGFAEVEVDTENGVIKVLRYVVAHDIGQAINPQTVEGQLEGGVIQGIGFALTEDFIVDKGTGGTLTDSFATYKIPSALDIPEIEIILVEEPAPSGPFGAKGVGEPGLVNVAPSIANAVYDAIGIRISSLPMTPEKVLEALKTRK